MYFTIGTHKDDTTFSYLIQKNPNNLFKKEIRKEQIAYGKYIEPEFMYLINVDYRKIIEKLKQLNKQSYITPLMSMVCPYNLSAFYEIFRSVIHGKYDKNNTTEEDAISDRNIHAIIGSFKLDNIETFIKILSNYDIYATIYDRTDNVCCLKLQSYMNVTEFIQKIYVLSYYFTLDVNEDFFPISFLDKIIKLSQDWINDCENENIKFKIIKKICKNIPSFIDKFDNNVEEKNSTIDHNVLRLHDQRHDMIINLLKNIENKIEYICEFGCGKGKLIKKLLSEFKTKKIIGFESDNYKVERSFSKCIKLQNILYPNPKYNKEMSDVIILSEVIEHLDNDERIKLIKLINNSIKPKYIILTTPNKEYNINYGLADNDLRHRQHKIEYDTISFKSEILDNLTNYSIEHIKDIEPSFIIIAANKHENNGEYKNKYYDNVILPISLYEINENELTSGYCANTFKNRHNIFYLGHTISPVDYNPEYPDYLEHLFTAYDYYEKRGIYDLVLEHKEMGSRTYVLLFKDIETAKSVGFNDTVIINSRQGHLFITDDILKKKIHDDYLKFNTVYDYMMLDCELTPWLTDKTRNFIKNQFMYSIDSLIFNRIFALSFNNIIDNDILMNRYLNSTFLYNVVSNYTIETEMKLNIFGIISYGNIKNNKFISKCIYFGINNHIKNEEIKKFVSNDCTIFKPIKYYIINIKCNSSIYDSKNKWDEYCKNGGEGFVVKPLNPINYTQNGYLIQPMLKVRGCEYLRLIYGVDYLDNIDMFYKRNTKLKRIQSIQEFELGNYILRSFLDQKHNIKNKYIASFIGSETVNYKNIDATL